MGIFRYNQNMAYTKNNLATGATITKSALDNMENGIAAAAEASSLSTVAKTGSYADLSNKPTNPVTGDGINSIKKMTQSAYDALATKDANTLYVVSG